MTGTLLSPALHLPFDDQLDALVDAIVSSQSWFTRIAVVVLVVYTVVQVRRLAGSAEDLTQGSGPPS